jgi:hypothetical protein
MFKSMLAINWVGLARRLLPVIGLILLLSLLVPTLALADSPETCAKCHDDETKAWENSPHAKGVTAVTCEDCHGSYVADHPESGVMQLTVDSSVCEKCHSSTFAQWENTVHAQAGVQCIGCHLSHSQEFRLSDKALCAACHREQLDTAHGQADISCIDCHLSSANAHGVQVVGEREAKLGIPVANHDFTAVLSKNCVSCHGQVAHRDDIAPVSNVQSPVTLECQSGLMAKLEATQQINKSLQTLTPISLGLGMGIGGTLGIVFMLILGYVNQYRVRQ